MYEEEVTDYQEKVENMKAQGKDEYDIKKQVGWFRIIWTVVSMCTNATACDSVLETTILSIKYSSLCNSTWSYWKLIINYCWQGN